MKKIEMSVVEVIKELSKYPPTAKVYFNSDGCFAEPVGMVSSTSDSAYPELNGVILDSGFKTDE